MNLKFHWFLPTSGDGRAIIGRGHSVPLGSDGHPAPHAAAGAAATAIRPPDIDYLAQVAQAAEHNGFEGVLTPTGSHCEDAWLTTAALIRETQRLKFLVAFRSDLTDAVRADGRDLPADFPGPPDAQRGHRGPGGRAAPVR